MEEEIEEKRFHLQLQEDLLVTPHHLRENYQSFLKFLDFQTQGRNYYNCTGEPIKLWNRKTTYLQFYVYWLLLKKANRFPVACETTEKVLCSVFIEL